MDLIEEIRATQNHYMSKHHAMKIVDVFIQWVSERKFINPHGDEEFSCNFEMDDIISDLRSMLSTPAHTK